MVPRFIKAAWYFFLKYPMMLNGWFYRHFLAPRKGELKVHLGPGKRNYIQGWINVDANLLTAKIDVWADLKNKIPFRDDTIDAFYSHHMIEHLPDDRICFHLSEIFRCLKPGGIIRVGGPNGDVAMQKFFENDLNWFSDFPDKHSSIGGKLTNFIFCRGEHLTILTESYLRELLSSVGFADIKKCFPRVDTNYSGVFTQDVLGKEYLQKQPNFPDTIIIEAIKPLKI